MNIQCNENNYILTIELYWGSDKSDISKVDGRDKTYILLQSNNITQIDIISTLTTPFVYGSFIYSDPKENSHISNLIENPVVHGRISFIRTKGMSMADTSTEPFADEFFIEDIFITGIETIDGLDRNTTMVKFSFASEDILKFKAKIEGVSTFNKDLLSDSTSEPVNTVIRKMFASVDLDSKLDTKSFEYNSDISISYINSANDNLINSLDYVYRKTFDDNFFDASDCRYTRIIYDYTSKKYKQWSYNDFITNRFFHTNKNDEETLDRNVITVETGKVGATHLKGGIMSFQNSGNAFNDFENFGTYKFVNFDYLKNEFTTMKYDKLDDFGITDNTNLSSIKKSTLLRGNGKKFKDLVYERFGSTSYNNCSLYDSITNYIFYNSFYRVISLGNVARKAGDMVFVKFSDSNNTAYEYSNGDYLITAVDNRITLSDGSASFLSIMDLHRPYIELDKNRKNMY